MIDFAQFMSGWGWAAFSLVAAMFSALIYLTNQYLRQPGHILTFWMRVMVVFAMTPFVLFMDFPTDWWFYAVVLVSAVFGASADVRMMNVVAEHGGGVVSRLQPLTVFLSFFMWLAFDPASIQGYFDHPINTTLILTALVGCVWFSSRLRKCHISAKAATAMLPALLAYAVTAVLNKYSMHLTSLTSAVFGYMYVQSVGAVFMIGGYAMWQERKKPAKLRALWRSRSMIIAATLMTLGWLGHMTFKNYAMAFTENPSYQGAVNLTTPVFIALFYTLIRHKEEADVKSGMGVVLCALLLALATAHG